jgi:hypothetical protein
MVAVTSLVLPILLAALLVFIASSVIHMVLPYHRKDVRKLPDEDAALDALGRLGVPPGDYAAPHAATPAEMNSAAFIAKMRRGPVVLLTVSARRSADIRPMLVQWFLYCVVVGVFVAYITGRVFGPGADYLAVFRLAGTTAFLGYALALAQHSIWWEKSWRVTLTSMADGLLYGLLTAGAFGWLWPQ